VLWICAEDSGIWLRLWVFGLHVRESIANAGMRDSFGIVQLSGKPGEKLGEKRKYCRATVRGAGSPEVGIVFVCLSISRECSRGKETHME